MFYLFKLKRFLNLSNTIFFKLHFNNKVQASVFKVITVDNDCGTFLPTENSLWKKKDLSGTLRENLGGGPHLTCWGQC